MLEGMSFRSKQRQAERRTAHVQPPKAPENDAPEERPLAEEIAEARRAQAASTSTPEARVRAATSELYIVCSRLESVTTRLESALDLAENDLERLGAERAAAEPPAEPDERGRAAEGAPRGPLTTGPG